MTWLMVIDVMPSFQKDLAKSEQVVGLLPVFILQFYCGDQCSIDSLAYMNDASYALLLFDFK